MGKAVVTVCIGLALLVARGSPPLAAELGIVTGSEKGTYYQFGLNMQGLVKPQGIDLKVYPSKGSVENIHAVFQRPGVQLGIVQADVLAFVARLHTDPTLKRIAKKTKMVFPLYNEEVHLLGRREISSFDDLAGRRVAIGQEGSGTYLTAKLLFKVSEVAPSETVLIDTDQALAELKAGRIDAMFYVAGYPVRLLVEKVAEQDGLALIPITNKSVTEFYPTVEIPSATYAWQASPVPTVAVKAVLVSYDYRRNDCESVGRFAKNVYKNIDVLRANGHPKWKSVDLDFDLKGWEQYDCVAKHLGKPGRTPVAKVGDGNPVLDAMKAILDE